MDERAFLDLGERLTKALLGGDFVGYRALFGLPVRIAPRGGPAYVLETEEAMRHDFGLYHDVVRVQRVTDIYRRVRRIADLGGGAHRVEVEMHILSGAVRLVDPFMAAFTLIDTTEGPRITAIESALGHIRWTLGEGPLSPT